MRARLVNADVKRVLDAPLPPLDWGCVAVWSVIYLFALAEIGAAFYWLFRLGDLVCDKLARLIP